MKALTTLLRGLLFQKFDFLVLDCCAGLRFWRGLGHQGVILSLCKWLSLLPKLMVVIHFLGVEGVVEEPDHHAWVVLECDTERAAYSCLLTFLWLLHFYVRLAQEVDAVEPQCLGAVLVGFRRPPLLDLKPQLCGPLLVQHLDQVMIVSQAFREH